MDSPIATICETGIMRNQHKRGAELRIKLKDQIDDLGASF